MKIHLMNIGTWLCLLNINSHNTLNKFGYITITVGVLYLLNNHIHRH